jgi:histidinol phosphatase-like enzyme
VGDKLSDIEAGQGAGIGHLFRVDKTADYDGVTAVTGLPEVVEYLTAINDAQILKEH